MRYWAYFLGKLIVAAAVSQGLYLALCRIWPPRQQFDYVNLDPFAHNLWYTVGISLWFSISCGLLYLAIWDQRYRCRVCLRRLRMPIETGSWGRMLQLGRPEIEYICTYGHGKLNVSEVQISGSENPAWTPHPNDIWTELASAGQPKGKDDHPD